MRFATGHRATCTRNIAMAQSVCVLAFILFFSLVCELNAGVLSPISQCFGEPETRRFTQTITRLSLRGGETGPVLSETTSQNETLRQTRGENPLNIKNNIVNVLKNLLSGKLARQADTAKSVAAPLQKEPQAAVARQETAEEREKREDDGWVEISDIGASDVVNPVMAKAGEQEVGSVHGSPVEAHQDKAPASEVLPAEESEILPATDTVLPVMEEATTEHLPEVEEPAQEAYKDEEALEEERPIVPQAFESEIDSDMFESAMAESSDVQASLSAMKNKVGSLRRTQSELEIKLARYHGEDPATVQQDDMALPENLNMKVMQGLLEELVSKQEMLSGRVEAIAKSEGEHNPIAACFGR